MGCSHNKCIADLYYMTRCGSLICDDCKLILPLKYLVLADYRSVYNFRCSLCCSVCLSGILILNCNLCVQKEI